MQLLQALAMSLTAVPVFVWARPIAGARWALAAAGLSVLIQPRLQRALHERGALLPRRDARRLGVASGGRRSCGRDACWVRWRLRSGRDCRRSDSRARSFWRSVSWPSPSDPCALPAAPADDWSPRGRRGALGRRPGGGRGRRAPGGVRTTGRGRRVLARRHRAVAGVAGGRGSTDYRRRPPRRLGILAWEMLRADGRTTPVSVLVASALAYAFVTLVVVGAFASRFVEHVTERRLLSVAPPIFVAFAVCSTEVRRDRSRQRRSSRSRSRRLRSSPARSWPTQAAYADSPSASLARAAQPAPRQGPIRRCLRRCHRPPHARRGAASTPRGAQPRHRRRACAGCGVAGASGKVQGARGPSARLRALPSTGSMRPENVTLRSW